MMNKQLLAVIASAIVLFAVTLVGALAFTGDGSKAGTVHTMPSGQMMTGSTHEPNGMGSMMGGHTMPGGQMMTEPMHEMHGGQMMPGMEHAGP